MPREHVESGRIEHRRPAAVRPRSERGRACGLHYRDRRLATRHCGGELVIPTLVLLFGVDIKLAGSLSLAVSLPTMIVRFTRYSRDRSFAVLGQNRSFVLIVALGSIVGTFIGGRLLGMAPSTILLPLLAAMLIISAVKVWRHQ